MKLISLNITPAQKSKLRNLKGIKINPKHKCTMTGEGISMLVDDSNYNALTKRFDTNRGLLFKLSATEVEANKDLDKVADEDVRSVIEGSGLFKHKKAKKAIKHIVDALEGEMKPETTGKGLIKSVKKGIKKTSKKVVKKTKSVVKDIAKDVKDEAKEVQKDAKEELKKTIKKVRNQTVKAIPDEAKETVDLVKKSVKAVKKFDPKEIDRIIKSIPKFYKDEIKNTYVGEALREALVIGTDAAMDSAIMAMYSNPYTAGLAPMVQVAWEAEQASGQPMTRGVIEKIGLGLGLGLYVKGNGLYASGKGLSASGRGLRAGAGLSVSGRGAEMVKHKVDPFYLENKLTNRPTSAQKIEKQVTHEDKLIMGSGGGHHITGLFLEKPMMSGILKPRPLKRVSMLEGRHQ